MKTPVLFVVSLLASNLALAQYVGPGPTLAPHPAMPPGHPTMNTQNSPSHTPATMPANHPLMTAAQVQREGRDDMRVSVQGQIIRHEGGDRYIFRDSTGELLLDMDADKLPPNHPIRANTNVLISGKLDVDQGEPIELDVKHLQILP